MAGDPTPPPGAGNEALMIWLKMFGLIGGLALFCWVIFRLTRMLA